MPVYLVTAPTQPKTERLVEAPNVASARRHVATTLLTVEVAKGADLFRLAKAGAELEQSIPGEEPEAEVAPVEPEVADEAIKGKAKADA